MIRKSISEILKEVGEVSPFTERVKALKAYGNLGPLKDVLKFAYDPRIKFLLPEGKPPYDAEEGEDLYRNLYRETRKFYLFVEGGNTNINQAKRENLWMNMLAMIGEEEAELLCGMKDKNIPINNITEKLTMRAFPELFE